MYPEALQRNRHNRLPEDSGEWQVQPLKFRRLPPPPVRRWPRQEHSTLRSVAMGSCAALLHLAAGFVLIVLGGHYPSGEGRLALVWVAGLFTAGVPVGVFGFRRPVLDSEATAACLFAMLFVALIPAVSFAAVCLLTDGAHDALCALVYVEILVGIFVAMPSLPFMLIGAWLGRRARNKRGGP